MNYKNSDGSRGNTNIVRRNMEGFAGNSKVNGLKMERSREHREKFCSFFQKEAQISEGEISL